MNDKLCFEVDWCEICPKIRKKHTTNLCQAALDTNQIPLKYKRGYFQVFTGGHENSNAAPQGMSELRIPLYTSIINII